MVDPGEFSSFLPKVGDMVQMVAVGWETGEENTAELEEAVNAQNGL